MKSHQNQVTFGILLGLMVVIFLGYLGYKELFAVPIPPKITYQVSKHEKGFFRELFKRCNWSGYKEQLVEACNYSDISVRNYSVKLAGNSSGEFNIGQVCDLFDHFYNNWKYVNDPPNREYVAKASESIDNNFNGDCDDFAVLICSAVISIGGEARLNFAYNSESGHAFTEVNLGKTNIREIGNYITRRYITLDTFWYRTDEQGNNWLNLDWFAKHPGGSYFDYEEGTTYYPLQNFCQDFTN